MADRKNGKGRGDAVHAGYASDQDHPHQTVPRAATDPITVTFAPTGSDPLYYIINGLTGGSGTPVASGWVSGTMTIHVSGYSGYSCIASGARLGAGPAFTQDATVTVVFGTPADFYTILWSIFQYIGTNWGNGAQCAMPEWQFQRVIDWQVQRDPAYALHYAEAIAEYTRLLQQTQSPAKALALLFAENVLPKPKRPNVQLYVLQEFLTWQVAFGGFRAFGPPYVNYSGWMGGGTFEQTPPPYRALPSGAAP